MTEEKRAGPAREGRVGKCEKRVEQRKWCGKGRGMEGEGRAVLSFLRGSTEHHGGHLSPFPLKARLAGRGCGSAAAQVPDCIPGKQKRSQQEGKEKTLLGPRIKALSRTRSLGVSVPQTCWTCSVACLQSRTQMQITVQEQRKPAPRRPLRQGARR